MLLSSVPLSRHNTIYKDYNKVAEFEIKQHKKKVLIRTDEYFEKGIKHKLIFITDIQIFCAKKKEKLGKSCYEY